LEFPEAWRKGRVRGGGRGEGRKNNTFHGGVMDIFWNCILTT